MASEERKLRHLRREVEELERRLDGGGGNRSRTAGDESGAGGGDAPDLPEETITQTIGEQGMAPGVRRRRVPDGRDRTTEEVERQRREKEDG